MKPKRLDGTALTAEQRATAAELKALGYRASKAHLAAADSCVVLLRKRHDQYDVMVIPPDGEARYAGRWWKKPE